MEKLYVIRHFINAHSIKEALKLSKTREPEEVYISEEWFKQKGFINQEPTQNVKGF